MCSKHDNLFCVFLWLFSILVGCSASRSKVTQEPVTPPPPPSELLALPIAAQIDCDDDPKYRSAFSLWELPGKEPVDSDSATSSNTGRYRGSVKDCSVVTITAYAWSETDQDFYVYIVADPKQEYFGSKKDRLEGWLRLSFVDLLP